MELSVKLDNNKIIIIMSIIGKIAVAIVIVPVVVGPIIKLLTTIMNRVIVIVKRI